MSDRDQFLDFWTPSIGAEEAIKAWEAKAEQRRAHAVWNDLPGYDSPIDGRWIEGRAQRREDLRRNGCRPFEGVEQERKVAQERVREENRRLDRVAERVAWQSWHQLSPSARRALSQ